MAIAQVGIPLRDAHLLLEHKLRQVATGSESMPNLLLREGKELSHHNRRVRIQLEDRPVHEVEDGERSLTGTDDGQRHDGRLSDVVEPIHKCDVDFRLVDLEGVVRDGVAQLYIHLVPRTAFNHCPGTPWIGDFHVGDFGYHFHGANRDPEAGVIVRGKWVVGEGVFQRQPCVGGFPQELCGLALDDSRAA